MYDSAETDYKYTKIALEAILAHDRKRSCPPWIIDALQVGPSMHSENAFVTDLQQEFDPEFLIRVNLRYEKYSDAIEHALSLIRKVRILS